MAQFDVHDHPGQALRQEFPFVLDVHHDLLADLGTRAIVPLARAGLFTPMGRLTPPFRVNGVGVIMMPMQIVAVPKNRLGPSLANLASERYVILGAFDFMLIGV